LFQSCDTALDCLEVGKHTAQPSLVYIELSAALCLSLDSVLSLFLGSYEKDVSAVGDDVCNCVVCVVNHSYRLLKIYDIDTISLCVDVGSDFGVPSSCLMSEMNTCFQKLFH